MKDLLSEPDVTWLMPLNFEPRSLFPAGLVIDDADRKRQESSAFGTNASRAAPLYLQAKGDLEGRAAAFIPRSRPKREKHRWTDFGHLSQPAQSVLPSWPRPARRRRIHMARHQDISRAIQWTGPVRMASVPVTAVRVAI